MAVNVKMGVDLGNFTSGIKQGQTILKGLNAELKAADAEFKATGNAEQMMTQKSKTLNSQMNVQKGIVDMTKKALKELENAGIKPTDAAYQKLYAQLMNAQTGMYQAQAGLQALGTSAEQTAGSTDKLANSVNSIGKKISLDQVIGGINSITTGLENAAKKAIELGEQIWNSVMDAARWADDTATMAQMYGIDIDTFQRMQKLVTNGLDTTVEAILKSQDKLKKGIGSGSKSVMEYLQELHVGMREGNILDPYSWQTKDPAKMFWEVGQALMNMSDAYDKEAAAQALFGKSWKELIPLFTEYKTLEEYNAALAEQNVVSEESVDALAGLNDKVAELKGNFDTLSKEMLAQLAPALTDAANALNGMLQSVLDYLQTPEGKEMLESLGTAVSGLFDDLGKIDPNAVVSGFTDVFNKVVGSIQWLVDNKDTVIGAMEGIVIGWGALKLTGGALDILKLLNGLQGLLGFGKGGGAGAGGGSWVAAAGDAITKKISGLSGIGTIMQDFMPMFTDWFTHEGPMGSVFQGTESIGEWWERMKREQQERTEGFAANWDPNNPEANVLAKFMGDIGNVYKNQIEFWKQIFSGNGPIFTPETMEEADWRPSYMKDQQPVPIETEPEAPENAAQDIAEQVGTVEVPASLVINGWSFGWGLGGGGTGGAGVNRPMKHANGIWSVPTDNYLALLHKNEQVVPARQVSSRNFSSNLYIENMNMNSGQDAEGLAARIAAANRRTMSGYGS